MGVARLGAIGGQHDKEEQALSLQKQMVEILTTIAQNSRGGYAYV
jgi:hypothetical protein